MKVAFVHDHNFVYNFSDKSYYDGSGGVFNKDLWSRYLSVFDELVVVGREIDVLPNKLVLSSHPNVSFCLIKDAHSIKSRLFHASRIQKQIEEIICDIDFIIIRLPSFLGSLAFRVCNDLNLKFLVELVGDPYEAYKYHGSFLGKMIAPYELLKMKYIIRKSNNVMYVTKSKLQEKYPNFKNNIGISDANLLETISGSEVERFYNQKKPQSLIIGLIGTFHAKYKGQIELLKAIKQLKNQGYLNIKVYLVGTGSSDWILSLAKKYQVIDQIVILGALESGKLGVLPFLDKIDCYVHPSLTEGLPRVVIEAMSRGKVCLTSDAGGVKELIDQAFIHKAGDWQKLAKQIEYVYNLDSLSLTEIAIKNLNKSKFYLKTYLEPKRINFIKEILNDISN